MSASARTAPSHRGGSDADAAAADFEGLVRRLLELLGRLTGLRSTYLTAVDRARDVQTILLSRNVGSMEIPEGLEVDWSDTLCRRALEGGPACTDDVPGLYPDSTAARELGIRTYVTVPVRAPDGEVFGTLCGADVERVHVDADAFALMETLAEMVTLHFASAAARRDLAAANDTLAQLSYLDALTGLGNRRALDSDLADACVTAAQYGASVAVLTVDVDEFKGINDSLGHGAGDEVLREVGRRLVRHCRAGDVIARPGGDKFIAVLVDADGPVARSVAERLRLDVGAEPIVTGGGPARVTLSIGVAAAYESDPETLLRRADDALYTAKAAGRNVVHAVETAGQLESS